ncbi:hypothetical protein P280DRAFT_481555 [Massarina eburnea CBS 473.64]|uniref:Uncharacterized protein n=1 Tax=Massarina eburnea CBS 473.64 TaxID=1395130 RepID=A0A6A6RW98_9PLEO|nr:hypothetical protein P280DRAFT_481555 [Massarina eburnea CBS 473.64]
MANRRSRRSNSLEWHRIHGLETPSASPVSWDDMVREELGDNFMVPPRSGHSGEEDVTEEGSSLNGEGVSGEEEGGASEAGPFWSTEGIIGQEEEDVTDEDPSLEAEDHELEEEQLRKMEEEAEKEKDERRKAKGKGKTEAVDFEKLTNESFIESHKRVLSQELAPVPTSAPSDWAPAEAVTEEAVAETEAAVEAVETAVKTEVKTAEATEATEEVSASNDTPIASHSPSGPISLPASMATDQQLFSAPTGPSKMKAKLRAAAKEVTPKQPPKPSIASRIEAFEPRPLPNYLKLIDRYISDSNSFVTYREAICNALVDARTNLKTLNPIWMTAYRQVHSAILKGVEPAPIKPDLLRELTIHSQQASKLYSCYSQAVSNSIFWERKRNEVRNQIGGMSTQSAKEWWAAHDERLEKLCKFLDLEKVQGEIEKFERWANQIWGHDFVVVIKELHEWPRVKEEKKVGDGYEMEGQIPGENRRDVSGKPGLSLHAPLAVEPPLGHASNGTKLPVSAPPPKAAEEQNGLHISEARKKPERPEISLLPASLMRLTSSKRPALAKPPTVVGKPTIPGPYIPKSALPNAVKAAIKATPSRVQTASHGGVNRVEPILRPGESEPTQVRGRLPGFMAATSSSASRAQATAAKKNVGITGTMKALVSPKTNGSSRMNALVSKSTATMAKSRTLIPIPNGSAPRSNTRLPLGRSALVSGLGIGARRSLVEAGVVRNGDGKGIDNGTEKGKGTEDEKDKKLEDDGK